MKTHTNTFTRPTLFQLSLSVFFVIFLVTGCMTTTEITSKSITAHEIDKTSQWAILPIANYSESPFAGEKVENILESILRIDGVNNLSKYTKLEKPGEIPLLDNQLRFQRGLEWAKDNNFKYCIFGSIEEWRYKSGVERKPAVGITLNIQDVKTGEIYWTGTAAKTGLGNESVSGVAKKLVAEMLKSGK